MPKFKQKTSLWLDKFSYIIVSMSFITEQITQIRQQIQSAANAAQRDPNTITLLAVSKKHTVEEIKMAYAEGIRDFGENQLQEALPKIKQLASLAITWHFIGQIQSNKTQDIAKHFHWVHSIDREKIVTRLNDHRPTHLPPLNICLQVNIDNEPQKAGVHSEELLPLVAAMEQYPRLCLGGLMTLPQQTMDRQATAASFSKLQTLLHHLQQRGYPLDTLSMGMSQDFASAIAAGATIIRIGSGIFGTHQ